MAWLQGGIGMCTWTDIGIALPCGAIGEIRTTRLQCSASRCTSHDTRLAVNVNKGAWVCHHYTS